MRERPFHAGLPQRQCAEKPDSLLLLLRLPGPGVLNAFCPKRTAIPRGTMGKPELTASARGGQRHGANSPTLLEIFFHHQHVARPVCPCLSGKRRILIHAPRAAMSLQCPYKAASITPLIPSPQPLISHFSLPRVFFHCVCPNSGFVRADQGEATECVCSLPCRLGRATHSALDTGNVRFESAGWQTFRLPAIPAGRLRFVKKKQPPPGAARRAGSLLSGVH